MAKITPDDRVLKRGSLPFFWLGDTCWSAFTNMTDAEWQDYIIKRAAQGFNVVQVNALPQWDRCGSTLGLYPFPTQDGLHFTYDGTLNKAYFARAGRMAALAAHYGITLAVAVQWCNYVPGTWAAAKHPENILPAAMVEPVVKKICETFSAYDPVFLISGDADFETEQALQRYLWVTRLVQKFAPDAPLAYHLKGWSDALPQELAENAALYLYQSGHNPAYQYTARTLAESFRTRIPQKPVLNSEPCYEQMGYSRLAYGRHRREDCRRILWTSLLSGACAGITYGAHGVWNWYKPGMPENPVSGEGFLQAPLCTDALGLPGAEDFAFARQLCEGWGRWDFTPCPEVLLAYREEVPAARSGVRTVLYLPTAAPLPLADTLSVQKIYFIDLETRKTLPVQGRGLTFGTGSLLSGRITDYRRRITMLKLNTIEKNWASTTAARFEHKLRAVRERSAEKIPNRAVDGVHNNKADGGSYTPDDGLCWWTNGFWAGMLWQAYHATHDDRYAEIARFTERTLDECFSCYYGLHHDVGFMWLPSAVADYRLTGDADARRRGLHAAQLLAGRFNPAGFIRAWNDIPGSDSDTRGWAIIDCLFNIPLLYWASEETKDPRFKKIAMTHADTVAANFIRADGSVRHIVEFDPETGAFVRDYGGQGYAQGSSWTRGQTWALYGFVMSYKHTGAVRYLAMAQKVAEYFIAHIPADGRIPVDFCQPAEPKYYDDIAAAVAACGLIELASLVPDRQDEYLTPALKMLHALDDTADWDEARDGYLQYCSADYHGKEHNVNFTYGDYYFYEALLKLTGDEIFLW